MTLRTVFLHHLPGLRILKGVSCVWLMWGFTTFAAAGAVDASPESGWVAELLQGPDEVPEGWELLALLSLIALATLVTEDLTCVTTGLMIANGTLTWSQGVGACLFGILFGDFLLFLAGRKLGRPALKRIPLRWMIDPLRLSETEDWYHRRGGLAILISRFVPGTRLPAYVAAGLLGVPYLKFLFYFVLAALVWTPSLIWISTRLAGKALRWVDRFQSSAPLILLGLVLVYLLVLKILIPATTWRGRRELVGRWRRLTRPEYWSAKVLYFPVCCYLAGRWLRPGKHLMDFSACNPCIPGGGMVGESKCEILDAIGDRGAVADYQRLPLRMPLKEKCLRVAAFMRERRLDFPVVIKPDVGERGRRVVVAKSREDVEAALQDSGGDSMVQAFVPGEEFGVFYIRRPAEERGHIFAVTRKTFSTVTGDGVHNLEELILKDPRAVCQAETHFRHLHARLFEVPRAGERIQLTDVGNHARGTLFEDGGGLVTPALEQRVEEISRSLPEFYFGRYDFIAPDVEAFQRGEHLRVIELNGVSSEATSIYDPRKGGLEMVRTLLTQWRAASAIGWELQQRGHPRMSFRELLRHYDAHQHRENRHRFRQIRLLKMRRATATRGSSQP